MAKCSKPWYNNLTYLVVRRPRRSTSLVGFACFLDRRRLLRLVDEPAECKLIESFSVAGIGGLLLFKALTLNAAERDRGLDALLWLTFLHSLLRVLLTIE